MVLCCNFWLSILFHVKYQLSWCCQVMNMLNMSVTQLCAVKLIQWVTNQTLCNYTCTERPAASKMFYFFIYSWPKCAKLLNWGGEICLVTNVSVLPHTSPFQLLSYVGKSNSSVFSYCIFTTEQNVKECKAFPVTAFQTSASVQWLKWKQNKTRSGYTQNV